MNIQLSILKKCRVCGLEAYTIEGLEKFKKHKLHRYGREAICNQCENKRARAYKKENRGEIREKGIEQTREYNRLHREERRTKAREYYIEHPERVKAGVTARRKVSVDEKCSRCGSTEKLERHHPDYRYPRKIVTLCAYCHSQLHHKLCGSASTTVTDQGRETQNSSRTSPSARRSGSREPAQTLFCLDCQVQFTKAEYALHEGHHYETTLVIPKSRRMSDGRVGDY